MHYVYILKSKVDGSRYIGVTGDPKRRFMEHNSGNSGIFKHKNTYDLQWYCSFVDEQAAFDFEQYLKSSSGYAFTKNIGSFENNSRSKPKAGGD